MLKIRFGLTLVAAGMFAASAFATTSLQDWEINVNGATYFPSAPSNSTLAGVPGLVSSSFNSTTGLGSLTLTFKPGAAGSYYLGGFFYIPAATPFYNEYGVVNGSAAAGQTYQIDVPEDDVNSANHGDGTIVDNLAGGTLDDTNSVPGGTDNFLNNCGANGGGAVTANCDDFVSTATGYKFNLTSNQYAVLTFDFSTSNPGGFSLETVGVNGSNVASSDVFDSSSLDIITNGTPPPPTVPEPASLSLGVAAAFLMLVNRKRLNFGRSGGTN